MYTLGTSYTLQTSTTHYSRQWKHTLKRGLIQIPRHVISSFACLPSQGIDLASFYSFYSEPVTSPPPAIKPFFDVPALMDTVKVKTVKDAADEMGVGIEDGLRQDIRTYSIRANVGLYKQLFGIWHSTTLGLNSTAGWFSSITFQVMSNNMIRESDRKGGDVLGLKPGSDPLIMFRVPIVSGTAVVSYQFTWTSPGDDRKVYAVIDKFMVTSMDIARSQDRFDRYIYLNYASANQQPLRSYGSTQIDFLRKVQSQI
ncbi:hypothetical protein FRC11_007995 [Ceratobasidium sp. 423]|nr:hypothetical protein FRC11_007995 [Ceratobasidium sp. 423]